MKPDIVIKPHIKLSYYSVVKIHDEIVDTIKVFNNKGDALKLLRAMQCYDSRDGSIRHEIRKFII